MAKNERQSPNLRMIVGSYIKVYQDLFISFMLAGFLHNINNNDIYIYIYREGLDKIIRTLIKSQKVYLIWS